MKNRRLSRGAVLIISLWVLTLLTLLAVGLAYRMSLEIRLAEYDLGRLKLFYLVQGGLREAAALLREDDPNVDSFQDAWAKPADPNKPVPFGDGSFYFTVEDELSRINLNMANSEILLRIPEMEEEVALSLRFWRGDQDLSPAVLEEEEAYYHSLGHPLERERQPIQSLEELTLVRGMTPSLHETLRSFFTVYGPGKVNLNTASLETLIFLGLEESVAEGIVQYRLGNDGERGTEDDQIFEEIGDVTEEPMLETLGLTTDQRLELVNFLTEYQQMLTVQSDHFRIRCKAISQQAMTKEVIVVLQRVPEGLPVIKYWHED